jgi:hypothetical protein
MVLGHLQGLGGDQGRDLDLIEAVKTRFPLKSYDLALEAGKAEKLRVNLEESRFIVFPFWG